MERFVGPAEKAVKAGPDLELRKRCDRLLRLLPPERRHVAQLKRCSIGNKRLQLLTHQAVRRAAQVPLNTPAAGHQTRLVAAADSHAVRRVVGEVAQ